MQKLALLGELTKLGHLPDWDAIRALPGAGVFNEVCAISHDVPMVLAYFQGLNPADQHALIRAIAVYEDSVSGLGSTTVLDPLFRQVSHGYREIFDWVLGNTGAYDYFARGARSLADIERHRREVARREKLQQIEAKERAATRATEQLFKAVQRGDVRAVRALLSKGADPTVTGPNGEALVDTALSIGHPDIAALLEFFQ